MYFKYNNNNNSLQIINTREGKKTDGYDDNTDCIVFSLEVYNNQYICIPIPCYDVANIYTSNDNHYDGVLYQYIDNMVYEVDNMVYEVEKYTYVDDIDYEY